MARTGSRDGRPVEDAARDALGRTTRRVRDMGTGVDPTSVHEARKAIRRLRATLDAYRPVLRRRSTDELAGTVQELARHIGAVRDLDVLHDRLSRRGRELDADLTPWVVELCWQRARAREALRDRYAAAETAALMETLARWGTSPPFRRRARLDRPVGDMLRPRLARRVHRLAERLETVGPDDPAPVLHALRKQAKQARYGLEVAAAELDGRHRRTAGALHRLTDVLGELQDSEVATDWLGDPAHGGLGTERDLGMLLGVETAERRAVRARLPAAVDEARRELAALG